MAQRLLTHAQLATLDAAQAAAPYGLVRDACLALSDGHIAWCGPSDTLPAEFKHWPSESLEGRLVTPALIDCHTHLVYGGRRHLEFEQRLNGVSYETIARAGGGINATVQSTRALDEQALLDDALTRVDGLIAEGVATVEIKSGYGLDTQTELRMLRVARAIGDQRDITVRTSFLGAHTVPRDFTPAATTNDQHTVADAYLEEVCLPTLEQAAKLSLADAVDGFCESIAFSPAQIARVFDHAKTLGLPVKLHAEQLSLSGGTALACQYQALSADHLEHLDTAGVQAMSTSGTVAVLLPGAFYTLRETQHPPVEALRQHAVPIAIATDMNPGSSPLGSLLTAMNMACTLFKMTPEEALAGVTIHAARALGLLDRGQIRTGLRADLAIWNVDHPAELAYGIGFNPLYQRWTANY